jgi:hypothetical protein
MLCNPKRDRSHSKIAEILGVDAQSLHGIDVKLFLFDEVLLESGGSPQDRCAVNLDL